MLEELLVKSVFTKMHKCNTIKRRRRRRRRRRRLVNLGLLEHKLHVLIQRLKNKENVKVF
jgi:hypothetical protein